MPPFSSACVPVLLWTSAKYHPPVLSPLVTSKVQAYVVFAASAEVFDWQHRSFVLVTLVSGAVGGVKSVVYSAVPLTIRTLEIKPR